MPFVPSPGRIFLPEWRFQMLLCFGRFPRIPRKCPDNSLVKTQGWPGPSMTQQPQAACLSACLATCPPACLPTTTNLPAAMAPRIISTASSLHPQCVRWVGTVLYICDLSPLRAWALLSRRSSSSNSSSAATPTRGIGQIIRAH